MFVYENGETSPIGVTIRDPGVIVNFTPTGMIPTREMTPHVPLTPAEIVSDVLQAVDIGITMVHLHARNREGGEPAWDPDLYEEIIMGIRKQAPELVICVSTSGRNFQEFDKRSACLALNGTAKPDMASLTLSSLNFNRMPSVNSPDMIMSLARAMNERGIKPELEAFDAGMINYAHYLIGKGIIRPPFYFNLIFGNIACAQADLLHAGVMVRDLPPRSFWSFAGIGEWQVQMNSIAIASGGGVRVGLEDNIWFDRKRSRLATNRDLLRRVHSIAEANERPVMSSASLRNLLELEPGNGRYGVCGE